MKRLDDSLGYIRSLRWPQLSPAGRAVGRRILYAVLDLVIFGLMIGLWLVVLTRGVMP